jgi:hypothetical protein
VPIAAASVVAHDVSLLVYNGQDMLVPMVCFTCLGLWVRSAANG